LQEWKASGESATWGSRITIPAAYGDLERLVKTKEFEIRGSSTTRWLSASRGAHLPLAQETGTAVIVNRPFAQAACSRGGRQGITAHGGGVRLQVVGQFFLKYHPRHPAVTRIPATHRPQTLWTTWRRASGNLPDAAMRSGWWNSWTSCKGRRGLFSPSSSAL